MTHNLQSAVLLISSLWFCAPALFAASPGSFVQGCGLYGLMTVNDSLDNPKYAPLLNDPFIRGLSLRVTWKNIHPTSRHVYDWSSIDNAISRLRAHNQAQDDNKKLMLRVLTGTNTPDWVYAGGVQPFTFEEDGQDYRIPVPWDSVYLTVIGEFIQTLGQGVRLNSFWSQKNTA